MAAWPVCSSLTGGGSATCRRLAAPRAPQCRPGDSRGRTGASWPRRSGQCFWALLGAGSGGLTCNLLNTCVKSRPSCGLTLSEVWYLGSRLSFLAPSRWFCRFSSYRSAAVRCRLLWKISPAAWSLPCSHVWRLQPQGADVLRDTRCRGAFPRCQCQAEVSRVLDVSF